MANDHRKDEDNKMPRSEKSIPAESIEEIKHTVLFGSGYKRPPRHTRFKKGQSGNPNGRPKAYDLGLGSSRSANALVLKEAERPINVREGTETRQMPVVDAINRAQEGSALRGNPYSLKDWLQRYDYAEREERERRLRNIEFWKEYQEQKWREIAEAKSRNETPPSPLPHPDDILIDYEKGVQIKGPINEEELAELEKVLKHRDVLIIQDALDQREAGEPQTDDPDDRPGSAMVYALLININLPARFQISDNELLIRTLRYEAIPKRVLVKELFRAWREVGDPRPRGYTFSSVRACKRGFDLIFDVIEKARTGGDIKEIARSELDKYLSSR